MQVNTNVMNLAETITVVKTLGERVAFARKLREMTQAELAAEVKCAQGTIGNIEAGQRKTLRNLVAIARALNVSADWLADGKGPSPRKEAAGYPGPLEATRIDTGAAIVLTAEERELVLRIRSITGKSQA
jgi:transcriptional regulator with XRE-family HTH domain